MSTLSRPPQPASPGRAGSRTAEPPTGPGATRGSPRPTDPPAATPLPLRAPLPAPPTRGRARLACALALVLACAGPLAGQEGYLLREATAGSEAERYLRVLQTLGEVPLYPWGVRGFSPAEVARLAPADTAHPWTTRLAADSGAGGLRVELLRPALGVGFQSSLPEAGNDGAVWAGRGVTGTVSAGVALRAGALSLRLEPLAFWTENRGFALMPTGAVGELRYADPQRPRAIDAPQRFGDGAYGRLDPGQSTLRLDLAGVAAGVSTANQHWGPGLDYPLLLGTNAGGLPHAFVGTASPWRVGIGTLHTRVIWGWAAQSPYSPVMGHGTRRYVSGLVASFTPRWLPGLELGGARFFHTAWPRGGLRLRDLAQPFQAFLKEAVDSTGIGRDARSHPDNQLASAFLRWVLPGSGMELWAEYVRNDHSWDALDFVLEPDHASGFALGGRKVWRRGGGLLALRAEWVNTQPSHLALTRRWQGFLYTHSGTPQGHTHRGQLLGSLAAYGGGGGTLGLDAYHRRGRWTLELARTRLREPDAADSTARGVDVLSSLSAEALYFAGGVDLIVRVRGTHEANRYFAGDATNFSAYVGARLGLSR